MPTITDSDQGLDNYNETWLDGVSTFVGMVLLLAFAVFIANEGFAYAEAKLDSFTNGPAWLRAW